uniref:calcium-binding protein n=1 Tax=Roseibium sp. TaxID=1936156 RepID=UPI003D0C06FC
EDAATGTEVGISGFASDGDAGDTVFYSVDDSRFTVDENGVVHVAEHASFDAGTEHSIDITMTATSTDGSTSSKIFSISVSNTNDSTVSPVTDIDPSNDGIAEKSAAGTLVGVTALASDADGDPVTYSLSDDRFEIDADGVVTVADHAFFDSQVENSIDLTVMATSADGSTSSEHFSISVTGDYDQEVASGDGHGHFSGSGQSYFIEDAGDYGSVATGDYNDRIDGGGSGSHDNIKGGGGDDLIFGREGMDNIFGGDGNDTLVGGADKDILHGGDGSDLFMYGRGDGNDTINAGAGMAWTDVIDLGGGPGVQSAGDYGTDWTVTINNGSVQSVDESHGQLLLSHDASGHIDFMDGSRITFHDVEEIHW